VWLTMIAAGAVQDILLSAVSGIADDGQKEYDKIPETVLETNIILPNPFAERGYFKLPMPYLVNAAYNMGRAMMRTARGGYSVGQGMNSIAGTWADSINPWGIGGTWANYVAPTILDPAVDLVSNTNFMEAPIAPPENPFGVGTDIPAQRYWNNTSPVYTTVAGVLDTLTGGDGVYPGAVSYSPNQYEYFFEWLGGGALATTVRSLSAIMPGGAADKFLSGEEVSVNDVPMLRRFMGNITTREDLSGYIAKRDEVMTVLNAMRDAQKAGDSERYQAIMAKYPEQYRMAVKVRRYEAARKKLASQIKKIREARQLSDADKKKMIDPLKKQQETLVDQANALMSNI